jgi:hypothetical protein
MSKAHNVTVTISRFQSVKVSGASLGSVHVDPDKQFVLINRKKPRAGRFETYLYPWNQVVAYQEGDGGKDGNAWAIVLEEHIISTVVGKGIVDVAGWVRIVDEDGKPILIRSNADGVRVEVVETMEPKTRK